MTEKPHKPSEKMDPVRKWTLIVLAVCALLLIWYLIADRHTPRTSQARVHAVVVPIASEVSGTVVGVPARNNQMVNAGDPLLLIERSRYEFAVETAMAELQSARQSTGASVAGVSAAEASVQAAIANRLRTEQDAIRLRSIKEEDPGAISERRLQSAEAAYKVAVSQVTAAKASLEQARQDLGATGDDNVRVLQAQAALDSAQLNLVRTEIRAPTPGLVTDVRVDKGNYAAAGSPQMTFIAISNVWVQADFTENNLGNVQPGDEVEIIFDAMPGRVFDGTVRSIGFGVALDTPPLGQLPTIDSNRQWLRDAQRFPVVIDFDVADVESDGKNLRLGSQATVVVYTGDSWILNSIAWINIRVSSLLSFAY